MADLKQAKTDPQAQLWDQIENVHAGMLGIEGSHQHMQPMAPLPERDNGKIWFFTHKHSDLCQALGTGAQAHFCVVGKDHDYYACLTGKLKENKDPERVEKYWSPVIAAWFEQGREDPDMTLLEFELADAGIWASTGSSMKFGWQIAKANLTDDDPEVGVRTSVSF